MTRLDQINWIYWSLVSYKDYFQNYGKTQSTNSTAWFHKQFFFQSGGKSSRQIKNEIKKSCAIFRCVTKSKRKPPDHKKTYQVGVCSDEDIKRKF